MSLLLESGGTFLYGANFVSQSVSIPNFKAGEAGVATVAVGRNAGVLNQGIESVAVGSSSGYSNQGESSVAIGPSAGEISQSLGSVAIGRQSGSVLQREN
jgi:hypothetical protein